MWWSCWQKHDFHRVLLFALTRQELSCATLEILSLNFTAMELSSDVLRPFLVWGLRSDEETVIGNRRLHLLESSGTSFEACLSFCTLEEMKLWSVILSPGQTESQVDASWGLYVQRLGTHDQMCLIFLFLASFSFLTKCNSSNLEILIRFCMEMFKYSKFDPEQTTTNSTIIVYISLDFHLWQTVLFW